MDPRFSDKLVRDPDVGGDAATGLTVEAFSYGIEAGPSRSEANHYRRVYTSQFPQQVVVLLELPFRWHPIGENHFQAEQAIVPRALVNDRALRAADFIKLTVHGNTDDGQALDSNGYVVQRSEVPAPGLVSPDAEYLEAGDRMGISFDIAAPNGGGLPPGVYQFHAVYDTTGAPAGSMLIRCRIQNHSKAGIQVVDPKTPEDRAKEELLEITLYERRDALKLWDAIERASKAYPESTTLARIRYGFLREIGDIDHLLAEYARLSPLVQQQDKVRLPVSLYSELDHYWKETRQDLEILADIVHGRANGERLKELSHGVWSESGEVLLYRHRHELSRDAIAVLEEFIRAREFEEDAPRLGAGQKPYDNTVRTLWLHRMIDQVVAAGGLPRSSDQPPPDPHDTTGPGHASPDSTPSVAHPPQVPRPSHAPSTGESLPRPVLALAAAALLVVVCVVVCAARARRGRP